MPKPRAKLRIRAILPLIARSPGQTVEQMTIDNVNAFIWVSLATRLVYTTGSGPTYQKKTMYFDNSMEDVENKSERRCEVRRVTHKARGLYEDEPVPDTDFDPEDREYEYIDVEDIQEFSVREQRGEHYLKTTYVMNNSDGLATTRESASPVDEDGRKSHRVRIRHQQWIDDPDDFPVPGFPAPRWYGVDITNDRTANGEFQAAVSDAWVDIERIDEFTTTTQVGEHYQKAHWKVIWDDEADTYTDEKFDNFLFSSLPRDQASPTSWPGDPLDNPPDANGDPVGEIEDEDDQGNPITVPVITDISMPADGRGWRLDPFQNIVNVRWFVQEPGELTDLYFQWRQTGPGVGNWQEVPPGTPSSQWPWSTGLYRHYEFEAAAVRAAAAANDDSPSLAGIGFSFNDVWEIVASASFENPEDRLKVLIIVAPYIPP